MFENKNILIIDPDINDIEMLTQLLERDVDNTLTIFSTQSPQKGVVMASQKRFDCILMELNFPKHIDYDLLFNLKAVCKEIPLIVVTNTGNQTVAAQVIKAGAFDYLNKEMLTPARIKSVLEKAMGRKATDEEEQRISNQRTVLVIDDSKDDLELIVRSLRKKGGTYRCLTASNGFEGMQQLEQRVPDCIILDYSLPGETGLQLLSRIQGAYPYVPVIIMTGQGNEVIAVEAMRRGADNYLVKSEFDADVLDKYIREAIEKKRLIREIEENKQALQHKQQELQSALQFNNLILESIPGLVFVKDSGLRIIQANKAFLELYPEDKRDKVIGFTTLGEYSDENSHSFIIKDKEAFEKGFSESIERITFPSGGEKVLHTKKKRFIDPQGEPFILGTATDITEKEQLILQLQKSNKDLEQFAYVASHDLKSPLSAISNLVTWIEEDYGDELPEGAMEYFEKIKVRAHRMFGLLNDLLSYSRVNNKIAKNESISLKAFIQDIKQMVDNHESFTFEIQDEKVLVPKLAFQLVSINLISNAIKHHPKKQGAIKITVETVKNGVHINFEDDGDGINPEFAHKVFDMFYTLKPRDEVEGSGMGLALVKKVIENYGGAIHVDTEYTKGCRMCTYWPSAPLISPSKSALS